MLALVAGVLVAGIAGGLTQRRDDSSWLLLASLVLWQPAIEELLFRGVLQGMLRRTTTGSIDYRGVSLANVVTSLAFVLIHFVNQPAAWAVGVFVPSLVFGFFRDRTNSVWPPLVLHIAYNAAFFWPLIATI